MSLLASTQGTPERVYSLICALAECDGVLERGEAVALLDPGYTVNGQLMRERNNSAASQTISAAISLGAVSFDNRLLRLTEGFACDDFRTFGGIVHGRLRTLPSSEKDAVVLETFAWVAVQSIAEKRVGWMDDLTASSFADAADKALPAEADDDGERRINPTKLPAWRRWLTAMGLNVTLPISSPSDRPSVDIRMQSELPSLGFRPGQEIVAEAFIGALASRMPYIDRGFMFQAAAARARQALPPSELSPLTSAGLRRLHDRKVIELVLRGDAANLVSLTGEPEHEVGSFHHVVVGSAAS